MIIKLNLVDDKFGANYIGKEINFNTDNLSWWQCITDRKAFSDTIYPDVVEFCFLGSDLVFRARAIDFFEAAK